MSLTVISPTHFWLSSTTSSFSIRWRVQQGAGLFGRNPLARGHHPAGHQIPDRLSRVGCEPDVPVCQDTGELAGAPPHHRGFPLISLQRMSSSASASVWSGVNGHRVDHHAGPRISSPPAPLRPGARLTCSCERPRDRRAAPWQWRAGSRSRLSMAAEITGTASAISGVRRVLVSVCAGWTDECAGSSRTSSNVKAWRICMMLPRCAAMARHYTPLVGRASTFAVSRGSGAFRGALEPEESGLLPPGSDAFP